MAALEPLPMSQKKDDLLKHLGMGPDIYIMMASETDHVYKWLTSDKRHLKSNCKRKPPYDWSDILEKSKDEAMRRIAASGNEYTSYYWKLAPEIPGADCPNWIARWFLYHKFRYRDGRNRNTVKKDGRNADSSSSKHSHHQNEYDDTAEESKVYDEYYNSQAIGAQSLDHDTQGYGYAVTASNSHSSGYGAGYPAQNAYPAYQHGSSTQASYQDVQYDAHTESADGTGYWDPVRDSAGR